MPRGGTMNWEKSYGGDTISSNFPNPAQEACHLTRPAEGQVSQPAHSSWSGHEQSIHWRATGVIVEGPHKD